jgi:L-lactate dehydrogenase complex protein LldG
MSSRDNVLEAIHRNKPEQSPLPSIPEFQTPNGDLANAFEETLNKIGGKFKYLSDLKMIQSFIEESFQRKNMIVSNVIEYKGTHDMCSINNARDLEKLDVAILQGEIAVAENGSIWVNGDSLTFRAVPFMCEHLVIAFNRKDLVYNMHEAYKRIKINHGSYGAFIAGPSKTADIEQSLVIGAHGARSMTAVMFD